MSTAAIPAQGSTLHIGGTISGPKNITGATPGFPTVVTATAHGLANGDSVTIAAVTGTMAALLNVAGLVIQNVTANTFSLAINTLTLTYVSGGTATPAAWIKVGNLKTIKASGSTADDIDVTDLDSGRKEKIIGLADSGTVSLDNFAVDADAGQVACLAAMNARALKSFKITYPSGATPVRTFQASVKKFPEIGDIGVGGVITGTVELLISGVVTAS